MRPHTGVILDGLSLSYTAPHMREEITIEALGTVTAKAVYSQATLEKPMGFGFRRSVVQGVQESRGQAPFAGS